MKKNLLHLALYSLSLFLLSSLKGFAQDNYIGEIKIFNGHSAPAGWALCNGAILPIAQYSTLYSIIGNAYGGNGTTNFALPNLNGNVPVGTGQGPGLTKNYLPGTTTGARTITLTANDLPSHFHYFNIYSGTGNVDTATGAVIAIAQSLDLNSVQFPFSTQPPNAELHPLTISIAGGNTPISNTQPSLTLTYIIALNGIYPSKN
ncbi:phage tail protein [Flavobacterium sp. HSC-61S13]|uniref:phage tail protein n=1 Tax=Flavobacterium sp. HSC-61S13 TaxID=2910963 RepID=UPI00209FFD43|nr:tail fiber protein [Flavobacterium sp. HSC-61S13]MCP1994747.1 microcystin-dependent protein [Flavobacterium sp. HSC-61S13]